MEVYYNSIHYTKTPEDAVALALKAGNQVELKLKLQKTSTIFRLERNKVMTGFGLLNGMVSYIMQV